MARQKKHPTPKKNGFNILAFVFGAFYFLVKGFPLTFCAALLIELTLLEVVALVDFATAVPLIIGLVIAVLLPRLLEGLFANRYMANVKEKEKLYKNDADVEYLSISPLRLVVGTILSLGLYPFYWMYMNWKEIKSATGRPIMPVFRSYFFAIFYIYPLLCNMRDNYKKAFPEGQKFGRITSWFLGILITSVITTIAANIIIATPMYVLGIVLWVVSVVCDLAMLVMLIKVQSAVNDYNAKVFPKNEIRKRITWGEVLVVVVGIALSMLPFVLEEDSAEESVVAYAATLDAEQHDAVSQILFDVYNNIYAYTEFCSGEDYEMMYYPEEYARVISDELDELNGIFGSWNLDVATMVHYGIPQHLKNKTQEVIKADLLTHVDTEGDLLKACLLLDQNAKLVIETAAPKIKQFYRENIDRLVKSSNE